jgi:uncharacterized protein (TIGR03435 family)
MMGRHARIMGAISAMAGTAALVACASQDQKAAGAPAFEAASVKISGAARVGRIADRMRGGPGSGDPGRITYDHVRLLELLMKGWDMESYRIIGPAWLSDRNAAFFDVAATLPPETTTPQFQRMLQGLLTERFKIKLHHEVRPFPGYELVVAPDGPKLKRSSGDTAQDPVAGPTRVKLDADGFLVLPPGHGQGISMGRGIHAKFQQYTMAELVAAPYLRSFIEQSTGATNSHVVDRTGLAGEYDFTLKFDARRGPPVVAPGVRASGPQQQTPASDPSGLPNFFAALERQLGLKLVKVKGFPLDTIVLDHVERAPVEN